MRAAVWSAPGEPLRIETVPDPEPGPGEMVLRVRGCGICGSDLHMSEIQGIPSGSVMGHEFAGEVAELGRDVAGDWKVGDRVCALPFIGCGRCHWCVTGNQVRCEGVHSTGLGDIPGAYAEYVRVGSREAYRLPEAVSDAQGACVEPLAVGLNAVNTARLTSRERALVIGGGPVGLAVAAWARHCGARHVVVSDPVAARRDLAVAYGATALVDPGQEELAPAFEREAGGPPDVIFECVGLPGLIQECLTMAPARSRIVVAGVCMHPDTIVPVMAILKELSLHFVSCYHAADYEVTLEMLEAGRIEGSAMITDHVSLDALPEAFEALKRPTSQCKVIVEP